LGGREKEGKYYFSVNDKRSDKTLLGSLVKIFKIPMRSNFS
jgi:hypothetical protein